MTYSASADPLVLLDVVVFFVCFFQFLLLGGLVFFLSFSRSFVCSFFLFFFFFSFLCLGVLMFVS